MSTGRSPKPLRARPSAIVIAALALLLAAVAFAAPRAAAATLSLEVTPASPVDLAPVLVSAAVATEEPAYLRVAAVAPVESCTEQSVAVTSPQQVTEDGKVEVSLDLAAGPYRLCARLTSAGSGALLAAAERELVVSVTHVDLAVSIDAPDPSEGRPIPFTVRGSTPVRGELGVELRDESCERSSGAVTSFGDPDSIRVSPGDFAVSGVVGPGARSGRHALCVWLIHTKNLPGFPTTQVGVGARAVTLRPAAAAVAVRRVEGGDDVIGSTATLDLSGNVEIGRIGQGWTTWFSLRWRQLEDDAPCPAGPPSDAAGTDLEAAGPFSHRVTVALKRPTVYRLCAWVRGSPARAEFTIAAQDAPGALVLSVATPSPRAGRPLMFRLSGRTALPAHVEVILQRGACPPTSAVDAPRLERRVAPGDFAGSLLMSVPGRGPLRACGYLVRDFDSAQIAVAEASLKLAGRTPTEVWWDWNSGVPVRPAGPRRVRAFVSVRPRPGTDDRGTQGWAFRLRGLFPATPAGRCVFVQARPGTARVVVPVRKQLLPAHPFYPKGFDGRCVAALPQRPAECEWTVRYVPAPGWGASHMVFTVPGSRPVRPQRGESSHPPCA